MLGRHKTTIYLELKRNQGKRGYRPGQAYQFADQRNPNHIHRRISFESWRDIESLIREDWSPEQISMWLSKKGKTKVSHEWIYQHILKVKSEGGDLYTHLLCRKKRKKRYGSHDRRGRIPNRVSDERPAVIEKRSHIGDWEIDTIVDSNHYGALVSFAERKSRLSLIARLPNKCAEGLKQAVIDLLPLESKGSHPGFR
jgi:IS30 family transposase